MAWNALRSPAVRGLGLATPLHRRLVGPGGRVMSTASAPGSTAPEDGPRPGPVLSKSFALTCARESPGYIGPQIMMARVPAASLRARATPAASDRHVVCEPPPGDLVRVPSKTSSRVLGGPSDELFALLSERQISVRLDTQRTLPADPGVADAP